MKKITSGYLRFIERHYWKSLIGYLLLTVFLGYQATRIEVRTSFLDLLPDNKTSVINLRKWWIITEKDISSGSLNGISQDTLGWISRLQEETKLRNEVSRKS